MPVRKPDFRNFELVLRRQVPGRPTLYEFALNGRLARKLVDPAILAMKDALAWSRAYAHTFWAAGYDYAMSYGSDYGFPAGEVRQIKTRSLNEGAVITDRASFEAYRWQDPDSRDYSGLDTLGREMPEGAKLVIAGPGGVLENVIQLMGYERLCELLSEDPDLVRDVFAKVGQGLVRYYEISARYDSVGALCSNDDWGFKTQTMLSHHHMRQFVFPWHERIVAAIHAAGKPALLHSCGNLSAVMDDIIDGMKYDAKHSFEDAIMPVEEAYERWGGRIAILGGMDVDFMVRATPAEIIRRSKLMLGRAAGRGGYALGTGNSVPEYIPDENYFAMTSAALTGERSA